MSAADEIREFIVSNICDFDGSAALNNGDNIFETGFVDSSFALQLVAFLEERFGIAVTDEDLDLENFSSIDRMITFIGRKQSPGAMP